MYRNLVVMSFGLAMGLTSFAVSPASAQEDALKVDERAYCNKLASKWNRYMPERSYGSSVGASPSAEVSVALTMCNDGRAAQAIPVLERALRSAGHSLPERAIGARP